MKFLAIQLKLFLLALLMLIVSSCKKVQSSEEKIIKSEGLKVKINAYYSEKFEVGLVAVPHAGIAVPVAGNNVKFFVTLKIDGREPFIVENITDPLLLEDPDRIKKTLANIDVSLSPNTDHLIYKRKSNQKDTSILVHYLDQKHPFVSSYYYKYISSRNPDWKKIPDPYSVGRLIIEDTTNSVTYRSSEFAPESSEYLFWDALRKLPPENELDHQVLAHFNKKDFTTEHILYLCSNWKNRSNKWKQAVRDKFSSIYQQIEQTGNSQNFYELSGAIETVLDSSQDSAMKKHYDQFISTNFEKGLVNSLGGAIQKDSAFVAQYRNTIVAHCGEVLNTNDPKKTHDVLFILGLLDEELVYHQALTKATELWPAYPLNQRLHKLDLDSNQKTTLIEKAQDLISRNSDNLYESYRVLETLADCELLRKMKSKYPKEINLRSGCDVN